MKTSTISLPIRAALTASVGCVALLNAPGARADMMLTQQTSTVFGSLTEDFGFTVPIAGTVTATVTPISWPDPNSLSSLNFLATTSSDVLTSFSALSTPSASFAVTPGVNYFAHVLGKSTGDSDSGFNLGTFSYSLSFVPSEVPLPASLWLLIGGIVAMEAGQGLRRRYRVSEPMPVPA